jgi:poly-beta-1,6-N-acetyl-D-glucosamine synthase
MWTAAELLLAFVALYPVCTAALWVAGGLIFRLREERDAVEEPDGGWPGVTVLIPAFNEEAVIATSVAAALAADYPELEVLVLDDGSTDATEAAAIEARAGDPRCRVIRDPVNRGKADRLNVGFAQARHELVAVTDADTHIHPQALKLLVARISRSPLLAAVAGAPHVTNRGRILLAMQVLEAAAIIGLIRRTQSLTGRVGVVAGVLGLFRRDRVLAVGGYDPRMATEDIDLSWKLLLKGWHTAYEPRALVGMQVPDSIHALWMQRKRWARGQGEVLHVHLGEVTRWRNHRMWLLSAESVASLVWVTAIALALVFAVLGALLGESESVFGFALAWGVAIAAIATAQMIVALTLEHVYDRSIFRALLVGALYPLAYWIISALAALHSEVGSLLRGPREQRVVWNIPRQQLAAESKKAPGRDG